MKDCDYFRQKDFHFNAKSYTNDKQFLVKFGDLEIFCAKLETEEVGHDDKVGGQQGKIFISNCHIFAINSDF